MKIPPGDPARGQAQNRAQGAVIEVKPLVIRGARPSQPPLHHGRTNTCGATRTGRQEPAAWARNKDREHTETSLLCGETSRILPVAVVGVED